MAPLTWINRLQFLKILNLILIYFILNTADWEQSDSIKLKCFSSQRWTANYLFYELVHLVYIHLTWFQYQTYFEGITVYSLDCSRLDFCLCTRPFILCASKEEKEVLYVNDTFSTHKMLCNSYFFNSKTVMINQRIEHLEVYIVLIVL